MTEAQNGPEVALQGEEAPRGGIGTCDTHSHTRERDQGPQERDSGTRRERLHQRWEMVLRGPYPLCLHNIETWGGKERQSGPPESLRDMGCWVA